MGYSNEHTPSPSAILRAVYLAAKCALAVLLGLCLLSIVACRSRGSVETERVELAQIAGRSIDAARIRMLSASLPCSLPVNLFANPPRCVHRDTSRPANNAWLIEYEVESRTQLDAQAQQRNTESKQKVSSSSPIGLYVFFSVMIFAMILMLYVSWKLRPL